MLEVRNVGMVYQPPTGVLKFLVRGAADEAVRALDDVSLTVNRGEVVGLLGPNGAGKSTLIKAITTLLEPTTGEIYFDGRRVNTSDPSVRRLFGLCLPDERAFYWRLTGRQNLELFAALAGVPHATIAERVESIMQERDLAHRDKRLFGYSSGMKAQLAVGRALLHDPDLLILDEPTRSLDPVVAADFCDDLRRMAGEGRAVLMASHRLDEVARTCDRVVVLIGGTLRWTGIPSDLADDTNDLSARIRDLVSEAETTDRSP